MKFEYGITEHLNGCSFRINMEVELDEDILSTIDKTKLFVRRLVDAELESRGYSAKYDLDSPRYTLISVDEEKFIVPDEASIPIWMDITMSGQRLSFYTANLDDKEKFTLVVCDDPVGYIEDKLDSMGYKAVCNNKWFSLYVVPYTCPGVILTKEIENVERGSYTDIVELLGYSPL